MVHKRATCILERLVDKIGTFCHCPLGHRVGPHYLDFDARESREPFLASRDPPACSKDLSIGSVYFKLSAQYAYNLGTIAASTPLLPRMILVSYKAYGSKVLYLV